MLFIIFILSLVDLLITTTYIERFRHGIYSRKLNRFWIRLEAQSQETDTLMVAVQCGQALENEVCSLQIVQKISLLGFILAP
jgi:hypothetical protein